jgi:hypothetical protein
MTSPQADSQPLHPSLITVTAAAVSELDPIWSLPQGDITQALFDVVPGVVQRWNLAAASVAADWYDGLRESEAVAGRFRAVIPDLGDQGAQALAGWGADALKAPAEQEPVQLDQLSPLQSAQSRVEGGLQKRLVNAANLTIAESSKADPNARGYMRRTRPGACKFCIMVASRGAVYTRSSSTFACHEHCYCEAVPAWGGKALPVGPYKPSDRPMNDADRARVRQWIKANMEDGEPVTTNSGRKTSAARVIEPPKESKKDIATRLLPGLEKSLASLRKKGRAEDSTQIQYHLSQIARLKRDLKP